MIAARTIVLAAAALLASSSASWGQSASDKAADRLNVLLGVPGTIDALGPLSAQKARVGPASVESPEPDLPAYGGGPTLPPLPPRTTPRPAAPAEGALLTANFGVPQPPRPWSFSAGPLSRQLLFEVSSADPLPPIGPYQRDRVSLADPTLELSAQSAMTPQDPQRLSPAPFAAWNLPDPFENAAAVRLRSAWGENPEPPYFPLQPTRK